MCLSLVESPNLKTRLQLREFQEIFRGMSNYVYLDQGYGIFIHTILFKSGSSNLIEFEVLSRLKPEFGNQQPKYKTVPKD